MNFNDLAELFQTIRLIEGRSKTDFLPLGNSGDPQQEIIRFTGPPSIRFPAKQIDQIKVITDNLVEIQTSFLSLYGATGLLPHHYTEEIIQRLQVHDAALKDFLDLFNHRMLSLYYRAWQKNRFYLNKYFTQSLFALIGYDSASLRGRLPIHNETLLYYAGYYANRHRSTFILQDMITDFFVLPAKITSFQGKWFFLGERERTILGTQSSYYNQLGISAVIGQRIWDCNHCFKLELGPLHYEDFLQFLPGCKRLQELIAFMLTYVGLEWSFEIQLSLKADQVPRCQLSKQQPFVLGQNTWLRTQNMQQDAANTILRNWKQNDKS